MLQTRLRTFFRYCIHNNSFKKSAYILVKIYIFIVGNILFNFSKKYASIHTKLCKYLEWNLSDVTPSYYDHEINLYNWRYDPSRVQFAESGVLSRMLIKENNKVLDLCCGDGIYPYLFLSDFATTIDAIDINEDSVRKSIKKYKLDNINFIAADILQFNFEKRKYDVVIWSEAVAYFTEDERREIFVKIFNAMKDNGTLYVRTPLEKYKHYGANQVSIITDQKDFEDSFEPFWKIEFQKLTQYKDRAYLNYYLSKA